MSLPIKESDIDLVQNIQNWYHDEFIKLYDVYCKKIYEFIFYKVWIKQVAEDLTSETFLKAYKNIWKFDINKKTKFSSRLYTIANNILIDHYRTNNTHIQYDWIKDLWNDLNMIQQIDSSYKLNEIVNFLETLDQFKKDIFIMRVWDKLSYEEISELTWKSVTNCKTTFSRTLKIVVEKFWHRSLIMLIMTWL